MNDAHNTHALPFATKPVAFASVRRLVQTWVYRRRSRAMLARLDPHLLRDIGLDENRARTEALKHFWIE